MAYHSLFIPVMYKIATEGRISEERLYYEVGERVLRFPAAREESLSGKRRGLWRLRVSVMSLGSVLWGLFSNYIWMMFVWRRVIHPIRRGMEEYGRVAFNVSHLESDLGMLSQGDLRGHISLLRHSEVLSFGEATQGIGAYVLPDVYVWRWALLLSLACLLSEMVYLRYFYFHAKERDIDKVGTGL